MINMLNRLVELESPSQNKEAVDCVGKLIIDEIQRLGGRVETFHQTETGNHILASWGNGVKGILLLCHMDTVFPIGTLKKMPFVVRDGKIYGPGALDMKGGIVVSLSALESLIRTGSMPPHPVKILFTSDEESGSHTSRKIIEKLAGESGMVFVMEPGLIDGSLKTWRKGVGGFKITVKGRAAHAGGNHQNGRNAIEELAHQVISIQRMTDYARGTTVNVGTIRGGTVSNVVPNEATAEIDVRVLQVDEWERILQAMENLRLVLEGTSIHVIGNLNRPPMPASTSIMDAFAKASKIALKMGLSLHPGGSGGGSDGNFVASLGIPVLDGLGPVGEYYHSENEYVLVDSLSERAQLLALLLRDWFTD